MPTRLRYDIHDWDVLRRRGEWPLLLVGNGASCAVSDKFAYKRLLNVANLSADDLAVFRALKTANFESVLDYLRVAALVCEQLGHDRNDARSRYDSIKAALIEAINDHHIAWASIPPGPLERFRGVLLDHDVTWSTSYDLVSYWAAMSEAPKPRARIGDCFWNDDGAFDPTNAEPASVMPMIYWIHGALHLYRTRSGRTIKRTHRPGRTLLDLLGTRFRGVDLPLFISEGTARQKMREIRGSEYLSHAYTKLADSNEDLVVFGQAFGPSDSHLVAAINRHGRRRIAYSVHARSNVEANAICAGIAQQFPRSRIRFFESGTHPLGS